MCPAKCKIFSATLIYFSLIGLIGLNYGWADRVDELIALLKDQDSYIRMKTAVVLGEIAEKSADKKFLQPAIEPLITALKDEDVTVRANAAVALGNIEDAKAVEPLIAALKDQNSHWKIESRNPEEARRTRKLRYGRGTALPCPCEKR